MSRRFILALCALPLTLTGCGMARSGIGAMSGTAKAIGRTVTPGSSSSDRALQRARKMTNSPR